MIDTTLIRLEFVALLGYIGLGWAAAAAQSSPPPVTWTVSATAGTARSGSQLTLHLAAKLEDGWHVYGVNQVEGGPTPLRITVDPNDAVQSAGTPSGTPPTKKHDASFDLDTEVFLHPFTLHIPLHVKPHSDPGSRDIALNVRFQACNDRICLPPKTIHLTVPVQISAQTQ